MNYHLILCGEFDELGELGELDGINPQFPTMNYPLVGNWANQTAEGNISARKKKRKKVKKNAREKYSNFNEKHVNKRNSRLFQQIHTKHITSVRWMSVIHSTDCNDTVRTVMTQYGLNWLSTKTMLTQYQLCSMFIAHSTQTILTQCRLYDGRRGNIFKIQTNYKPKCDFRYGQKATPPKQRKVEYFGLDSLFWTWHRKILSK